jgi:hypothetical protein
MPITVKYKLRHSHPGVKEIQMKKELGIQIVVNTTRQHPHRSVVHLLLTVVGIIGIVGLFLPFTFGTSPMNAVSDKELWRLALPFFLAVLASAASIRWVISGSFSGRERAIAYVVSASMAGVTLSLWFPFRDGPANIREWLAFVSPEPILALGVYFLIRNSRMGSSRNFNPVMAIQIAYLANAVLCLIAFFGDWQLGAYCVLVAALAFVLQIALASAPGIDVVRS